MSFLGVKFYAGLVGTLRWPSTTTKSAGTLERTKRDVVLGDAGFVFELEKRGYIQAGPYTTEVLVCSGWRQPAPA